MTGQEGLIVTDLGDLAHLRLVLAHVRDDYDRMSVRMALAKTPAGRELLDVVEALEYRPTGRCRG